MGEYVRNRRAGEEIKYGVMDHLYVDRVQIEDWDASPDWVGFYNGKETDELKSHLTNPLTLYALPGDCSFDPRVHVVVVNDVRIAHKELFVYKKGNRDSSYLYQVECAQKNDHKIYAVLIGERYYSEGVGRTILKCDCCEAVFSLTEENTQALKKEHPYWAK